MICKNFHCVQFGDCPLSEYCISSCSARCQAYLCYMCTHGVLVSDDVIDCELQLMRKTKSLSNS